MALFTISGAAYPVMSAQYEKERRSERKPLAVTVRIRRSGGTMCEGHCVDASDDGFGISLDTPLEVGEIVRLIIGRTDSGPAFTARVVWQRESRVGLLCVASED
jgi:hypothetical protein